MWDDVDVGAGLKGSVLKGGVRARTAPLPEPPLPGWQDHPDRHDARCDDKCANHMEPPLEI